jgi:hypothetical protein
MIYVDKLFVCLYMLAKLTMRRQPNDKNEWSLYSAKNYRQADQKGYACLDVGTAEYKVMWLGYSEDDCTW